MNSLKKNICLIAGRANPSLSKTIAEEMDLYLWPCELETFPDDEIHVRVQTGVVDKDVYLIQSLSPPVAPYLLELLLTADACRRSGARRISGIIPYLGYARQERREEEGEPVSARVMADLLAARLDRIICVDLHNAAVEGFFSVPVIHLTALSLLETRLAHHLPARPVIVAPDLGAVKLAQRYADFLDLPAAFIHKERRSGDKVNVRKIIGEVKGRSPVLVDDMISTGGTILAAIEALLEAGAASDIAVAATHGLFVGQAWTRFENVPISRMIVTDSVETSSSGNHLAETVSLGKLLAETILKISGESGISSNQ